MSKEEREKKKEERKKNRKKFKDTKVGAWLTEKFPDVAENALELADDFGVPGAGLLKSLFSNKSGVSQEDRAEFQNLMLTYDIEVQKIEAADRDSARRREVEIAKTDAPWLVKTIVPLLAIAWTVFTFVLT